MNLSHKKIKEQNEQGLYRPFHNWESFFDVVQSMHHQYDGFESIFRMLGHGFKNFNNAKIKKLFISRNRELLKFLDEFTTESCLDINAYPGSFSSLTKKGQWTGKNINSELLDEWVEITSGKIYQDKNQKFNLITGFPALGKTDDSFSSYVESFSSQLDSTSSMLLITTEREFKQYLRGDKPSNLKIHAVLSLPRWTWMNTAISTLLIWFKPGEQSDFFIGELSNEKGRAVSIIESIDNGGSYDLRFGKKLKAQELGETFEKIQEKENFIKSASRNNFLIHSLTDLNDDEAEINFSFRLRRRSAVLDRNVFHRIRFNESVRHDSESTLLSIDTEKVNLDYLALILKRYPKQVLIDGKEIQIALPSLTNQLEILMMYSQVKNLESTLYDLKKRLSEPKGNLVVVKRAIQNLSSTDSVQFWITNLPFPISGILRIYYSENRPSKKIEALFHFFEATAQFINITAISLLSSKEETDKNYRSAWVEPKKERSNWYKNASFGDWIQMGFRISKSINKQNLIPKKESSREYEDLGKPAKPFLSLLANKNIWKILDEANDLRNRWKGHGGVPSDPEEIQRAEKLESLLHNLREATQGGLQEVEILKPVESILKGGTYTNTVKVLVGNETPYKRIKVTCEYALDTENLYVRFGNAHAPVLLVPFIKYDDSSNAIYYYSRLNGDNSTHWVTYNIAQMSSMDIEMDDKLTEALTLIIENPIN